MPLTPELRRRLEALPDAPGVYLFKDAQGRVLYVGKAASLRKRVRSYFRGRPSGLDPKTQRLVERASSVEWIETGSEPEALLLEDQLIKRHRPRYNVRLRDDKRYPYLKLTAEPFPRLVVTRRVDRDVERGARYFGPYPRPGALREAYRALQRIFRVRTCPLAIEPGKRARARPCLDHDLGLCDAPCVGLISQRQYQQLVDEAALFLSGRAEALIQRLEREMREAAARLEFERAARLRDRLRALAQIAQIAQIAQPSAPSFPSFAEDENARADARVRRALEELQDALGLPGPPRRLEGFDVSTLQGHEPVASMVVFLDGRPAKSRYRRFALRVRGDDTARLAEAVNRRLARALTRAGDPGFTPLPDLILLDGGKGQLRAVRAVLRTYGLDGKLPIAALAKDPDRVYVPGRREALPLPRSSEAMKLLQRVRDEAHRFALEAHRRRRTKRALHSILDEVPGLGPARKRRLLERFGSLRALKAASVEELRRAGLPRAVAERLHATLKRHDASASDATPRTAE